jgi:hypothetical protein
MDCGARPLLLGRKEINEHPTISKVRKSRYWFGCMYKGME